MQEKEVLFSEYRITSNLNEININSVYEFISSSYWASDIPLETLEKAIKNSLCFGVLDYAGKTVGFARMVTDKATFAYLADVYILEAHRGQGLSKKLMQKIMCHPDLQGLRRMVLATKDAHELYKRYGFTPLVNQELFMELWNQNIYKIA